MRRLLVWAIPVGILAFGAYGYWTGTPLDLVQAVRRGDLDTVRASLARDPSLVHTKAYPQGYERVSQQRDYQTRTGESAWRGRYLIHEAAARVEDPLPMLEMLAAAGADLSVRIDGRSLLHLAAADGNLAVATWLLDRGLDANLANDCATNCVELGQTPLFEAQRTNEQAMNALLLSRGADPRARAANGRTPLHAAAAVGSAAGAFDLCRSGTDPTVKDWQGRTAYDIARAVDAAGRHDGRTELYGAGELTDWLKPGGGCEELAARAAAVGTPVEEDDARPVFAAWACARGYEMACRQ
ncbi:MAG: ankyrin repeat domain-containing protein [Vicinamibacterales bacterium]